jgi:cyclopropane fatty-acyl-phospholipid synthase-like methyltransferase
VSQPYVYGQEWGDLNDVPPLAFVLERYVKPYVDPAHTVLEIGPGGGRWTRHLTGAGQLYIVEYYSELLSEVRRTFGRRKNITFIKNNGSDFPGVAPHSVDFLFSFGVFVHLDFPIVEAYLDNIKGVIKPGANVVIHYADQTKLMAQLNEGFADNDPERMRRAVLSRGYEILEEDLTTMWHSSIIRFTKT